MILGVFDEAVFEEAEVDLESGDSLIFLTDGVIEVPGADGSRAGLDRVLQMLDRARGESAQRQAEAITTERLTVASGRIADDMTAFALKRP
jgi:sigma-B regulation protein RsbU (phosphoserine phosphatase)